MVILITGAGAPGTRGTVYALRRGAGSSDLHIVGVDTKSDNAGRYLVDTFHIVPNPADESYLHDLLEVCAEESVDVIIPQTTRETDALSRLQHPLLERGIKTMVSNAGAIEIANNKYRLLQECERIGVPFPHYSIARAEEELTAAVHHLGYPEKPVVVKPPLSNGMRGVRVLCEGAWDAKRFLEEKPSGLEVSYAELSSILRRGNRWPELLVTEYLPGAEYTVDLFVGSCVRAAVPRKRVAIRSGITFESSLDCREDLREFSIRIADSIGLRYAVGFQYKLDAQGTPKILESNPRVQGTMVASVFSGANVIWLSVRELIGDTPTEPLRIEQHQRFYRFWGGISVSNAGVEEI